jgi:hypothetical protein
LRSCEQVDGADTDLERPACFGSFRRRAVKQPTYSAEPTSVGTPTRMTRHCYMTRQFALAPRARRPAIFIATQRNRVQRSEMRIGRDVTVTIDSRSDPSSSRCQISRTRMKPRGFVTGAKIVLCERAIEHRSGGARRDRTDDLLLAKQALSQLSYGPLRGSVIRSQ